MPAKSLRPSPAARMVELLAAEKRRRLEARGFVTARDFDEAWDVCWAVMVTERAWPHATTERRSWRKAMLEALLPEARACFLGESTGFYRYVGALAEALDRSVAADVGVVVGQLVA